MGTTTKNRSLSIVGMAAVAVLLVVTTGVAFINASSAGAIAKNSELLHWSNVTAGTAAVSRAAVSQAIVFAVDDELEVAPAAAAAARLAIREAATTVDSLLTLAATAPLELADAAAEAASLGRAGESIIASLEARDILGAEAALDGEFERLYAGVSSDLAAAQRTHAAAIDHAEGVAGRIEGALRWLVTLFIPALAILLHRSIIRRKYRERRVELSAELEAQRRLGTAKDEFIAGISHELRTPLTSILGFSDHLMDSGMVDEAETAELIGIINQDSEELERMVEDLLTAARLEAEALTFDYTPVNVLEQARSVADRFARQGRDIRVTGTADLAWADGPRVRQIIRNLVSNREYTGHEVQVVPSHVLWSRASPVTASCLTSITTEDALIYQLSRSCERLDDRNKS